MSEETPINDTPGTANLHAEAAEKFESSKVHAKQAAEDLKAAANAKASELRSAAEVKAQELRGQAEKVYGDYRARARTLREDGEQYIRENPTKAVFTALGVGFFLGLIFRR